MRSCWLVFCVDFFAGPGKVKSTKDIQSEIQAVLRQITVGWISKPPNSVSFTVRISAAHP